MPLQNIQFKFAPNIKGILTFYGFLIINIALLSIKKLQFIQLHFGEVFMHTSNFVITSLLMGIISFIWIMQGALFKFVIWLGVLAIALNFVVETWVRLLNTPDIIDAFYGSAGVVITALVMLIFKKEGVRKITG
jgi:uncharacterized MnhB-related membrane protein